MQDHTVATRPGRDDAERPLGALTILGVHELDVRTREQLALGPAQGLCPGGVELLTRPYIRLLYPSDAADELLRVDLGRRRLIHK